MRAELSVAGGLGLLGALSVVAACSSSTDSRTCTSNCDAALGSDARDGGDTGPIDSGPPPRSDDNIKNGSETDVDCGGTNAPKCALGKSCLVDGDCDVACNWAKQCIDVPSCKPYLGGATCGLGEVGQGDVRHESCCRTLPVAGYTDPQHPGKAVYLDKYEITAGRVRAFVADITARYGGTPNIRGWVVANTPPIWDVGWNKFLPSAIANETVRVDRHLVGDRRPELTPGAPVIPDTDQELSVGIEAQFDGRVFVYLHGNNCSTHAGAFGFPTFFYPAAVLAKSGLAPRADGTTLVGAPIPASEHLEVKSMNCISNALLAAFCHWDGGQLATDELLDFITDSPSGLGNEPGCGTQRGTESPPVSEAATKGGRCADLAVINATYDAGGQLPVPNSPLNASNYDYPDFPPNTTHDKAWQISAPGRGSLAAGGDQVDVVRLKAGDEPWVDLHGNLNEAVLVMNGATFSGKFGLKYRGIGYQSARSELNVKTTWEGEGGLARLERAEARAGFAGGRCMRFK